MSVKHIRISTVRNSELEQIMEHLLGS
jgi:hypothetical protein